jgi:hypothetical protein
MMSINQNKLKEVLFDWVRDYSLEGCFPSLIENHIMWADQSGYQPDPPYITLKIITGPVEVDIKDRLEYNETDQRFEAKGTRVITLSINYFGQQSFENMEKLQNSLNLPEVREYFRTNEIIPFDDTGVSNITELLDTVFEERANLDVMFYIPYVLPSTIQYLEIVETPTIN